MRTFRIKLKCGEVVKDMDLIARITELLDERGWSKYQLAKEANISQSTISSMMKRGNNPTVSTIERCCQAFGIIVAEFFNSDLREKELTLEERKLVSDWRRLLPDMQSAVRQMISAALPAKKES